MGETSKTETATIDTQICDINKKIYTKTMKLFVILCTVSPLLSAPQYGQSGGGHNSIPSLQPPASASQSVACRTEQQVIWDTKYIEKETQECVQISVPKCSTAYKKQCNQVYKNECSTQYQQQCSTQYREEAEYYTETECNTDYKEDCEYQWEGTGNNKVWAPIPGTCNNNAYDKCGDVQTQKLKQVPYNDCQNVPKQVCNKVPKQECRTVTEQQCQQVPYQDCQNVPQQQCKPVHKKVPQRISRRVPKKVCDGGSGSGYNGGSSGSGFNAGSSGSNGGGFGFGGTGGFRNSEPDAELLPEKQVKANTRDKDAVNFGR